MCVLGKSTLLAVLGNREVPIPDHIDIFHLTREMPASEKTALQCVMEVDEERMRLEKLAEELVACEDDGNSYLKHVPYICLIRNIFTVKFFVDRITRTINGCIRTIR